MNEIEEKIRAWIAPTVKHGKSVDEALWSPPVVGYTETDKRNAAHDIRAYITKHMTVDEMLLALRGSFWKSRKLKKVLINFLKFNEENYLTEWTPGLIAEILPGTISALSNNATPITQDELESTRKEVELNQQYGKIQIRVEADGITGIEGPFKSEHEAKYYLGLFIVPTSSEGAQACIFINGKALEWWPWDRLLRAHDRLNSEIPIDTPREVIDEWIDNHWEEL